MDPATIERLAAEWPEGYRGGKTDAGRPIGLATTVEKAWANAERCLGEDRPERAAYWAGLARGGVMAGRACAGEET